MKIQSSKIYVLKQQARKKLGFYYRMFKQYFKNKAVFKQIIDLDQYPLNYYSVMKQQTITEQEVLTQVESGDIILMKNLIGKLKLQNHFNMLVKDYFGIGYNNLADIHQLKTVEHIVDNALTVRNSLSALVLQSSIMKRILQPHANKYYLELQPNLRLHLPYSYIKPHEEYIESRIGRGKINPHGQHKDSWRGHPENTLNVWVSLTAATDKNGLALLPQSTGYHAKFDATAKEISPGVKTYPSQQYVTDMQPGDALLFQAELLHGSIINMAKQTRVALSMRCTTTEPEFNKKRQFNYIKIDNNHFDNLNKIKLTAKGTFEPLSRDSFFAPAEQKNTSIHPVFDENQIKLPVNGKIKTFPRKCPHAGTDLLNGELNEKGQLICPSHRMCISGKPCE
ncbi:MAG: phytanoyl-CoA dioxygenase family protein [Pseudomonadota bacterium]